MGIQLVTNVLLHMLVHGLSQAAAARSLGINDAKISRVLGLKISSSVIDKDAYRAFCLDHPIMSALYPSTNRKSLRYPDECAGTMLEMLKDALHGTSCPDSKLLYTKEAADAAMRSGHVYDPDSGHLCINKKLLTEADMLYQAIPSLHRGSAVKKQLVHRGAELNRLAITMLLMKASNDFAPSSEPISGYAQLLSNLLDDERNCSGPVEVTRTRAQLILFSSSALCECLIESQQASQVTDLVSRLCAHFGNDRRELICRFITFSAWRHNQHTLAKLLCDDSLIEKLRAPLDSPQD